MSNEQPYDPYIPASGQAAAGASSQNGNQRTAALQAVSLSPSRRAVSLVLSGHVSLSRTLCQGACAVIPDPGKVDLLVSMADMANMPPFFTANR